MRRTNTIIRRHALVAAERDAGREGRLGFFVGVARAPQSFVDAMVGYLRFGADSVRESTWRIVCRPETAPRPFRFSRDSPRVSGRRQPRAASARAHSVLGK